VQRWNGYAHHRYEVLILHSSRYFPTKIQGIDIDYQLINKAIDNMTQLEQAHKKLHINHEVKEP
jgi:hypothetical protein